MPADTVLQASFDCSQAIERFGPRLEPGKPAIRVIAERPYCAQHGEPLAIPSMVLEAIARRHGNGAASAKSVRARRRDWARARLAGQIEARQEPGRAARRRWERMHGLLRAKVLAGEIAAELRLPDGETVYPSLEELRVSFPRPREDDRARLARLGNIPARLLFSAADLDRAFPPRRLA